MKTGSEMKKELLAQYKAALESIQQQIAYLNNGFEQDYETVMTSPAYDPEKMTSAFRMVDNLKGIEAGLTASNMITSPLAILLRQMSAQRLLSAQAAASQLQMTKVGFLRDYVYNIYDPADKLSKSNPEDMIAGFMLGNNWAIYQDSLIAFAKRKGIKLREAKEE